MMTTFFGLVVLGFMWLPPLYGVSNALYRIADALEKKP